MKQSDTQWRIGRSLVLAHQGTRICQPIALMGLLKTEVTVQACAKRQLTRLIKPFPLKYQNNRALYHNQYCHHGAGGAPYHQILVLDISQSNLTNRKFGQSFVALQNVDFVTKVLVTVSFFDNGQLSEQGLRSRALLQGPITDLIEVVLIGRRRFTATKST